MTTIPSQPAAARSRSWRSLIGWLLRIDGGFLIVAGLAALVADLDGYFFGVGPFASLFAQPIAIGSVEAHGFGALAGLVIWRSATTSRDGGGHVLALSVHLFLMLCNLLFWQVYIELHLLATGVVSTTAHALFVVGHLVCLAALRASDEPRKY